MNSRASKLLCGLVSALSLSLSTCHQGSNLPYTTTISPELYYSVLDRSSGQLITSIPESDLTYYRNLKWEVNDINDYYNFITISAKDSHVQKIANYLTTDLVTNEDKANKLLDFVSSYGPYHFDDANGNGKFDGSIDDQIQYAPLTLVTRHGDCDDFAILYASLLKVSDIPFRILRLSRKDQKDDTRYHLAVIVKGDFEGDGLQYEGGIWYYADPTPRDNLKPESIGSNRISEKTYLLTVSDGQNIIEYEREGDHFVRVLSFKERAEELWFSFPGTK